MNDSTARARIAELTPRQGPAESSGTPEDSSFRSLVETSLAQSMIIFDQQWSGFLSRPIALGFFLLSLVSITASVWRSRPAR